jgi:hypothetical protein
MIPSLWSADSLALVISARTSRDDQDDPQPEPGARSTGDATSDAKHAAFRSVVSVLVRFV